MQLPMGERRGPMFAAFFARAAAPVMQRDLAPILDRVRPDVVVREVAEIGVAPMAAARWYSPSSRSPSVASCPRPLDTT